jgi:4-amino-4-deoxy-L-arabinose transferase-like glycosyltransferase
MSVDLKPAPNESMTTLVTGILTDAQELMKQQFKLFKHEVRSDLNKAKDASLLFGIGVGLGLAGVLLLGVAAAYLLVWLFPTLPLWTCFGICGLVLIAVAAGLWYAGMAKIESVKPVPEESVQALKENVQWITNPK